MVIPPHSYDGHPHYDGHPTPQSISGHPNSTINKWSSQSKRLQKKKKKKKKKKFLFLELSKKKRLRKKNTKIFIQFLFFYLLVQAVVLEKQLHPPVQVFPLQDNRIHS